MTVEVTLIPTSKDVHNVQTTTNLEITVDLSQYQKLLSKYNLLIKIILEVTQEEVQRYEYAEVYEEKGEQQLVKRVFVMGNIEDMNCVKAYAYATCMSK
ncbi:hypothetical protein [Cellulosilyticum ruminicola]|uniref:hypothetical protein n=1 Tax=Cellulosilyticum ruminicola TaxID=425254 RepID=UPI0006CF9E17|nr:hypothetical protein [Cellulosilyticum ruminicola]